MTKDEATLKELVTKTPFLNGNDVEAKREEILNYFHKTFEIEEYLYKLLLNDKTFYMR